MNYTLETLTQEQQELLLKRFDYDFAWQLGVLMRERVATARAPVAITVAHGPDVVFSVLMPAPPPTIPTGRRGSARWQEVSIAVRSR
jgi:uncharacterized protein (UPF0303 family)